MTYYEWIEYFNKMKKAPISNELIDTINNSELDYKGNIKIRYLNQIVKLINFRLNEAIGKFMMKIRTISQNKDTLIIEINELKKEFIFTKKIAQTKYFDQTTTDKLITNITTLGEEVTANIKTFFSNQINNEIIMIINNLDINS